MEDLELELILVMFLVEGVGYEVYIVDLDWEIKFLLVEESDIIVVNLFG